MTYGRYIHVYKQKKSRSTSLVWGSLRLAPITIIITAGTLVGIKFGSWVQNTFAKVLKDLSLVVLYRITTCTYLGKSVDRTKSTNGAAMFKHQKMFMV